MHKFKVGDVVRSKADDKSNGLIGKVVAIDDYSSCAPYLVYFEGFDGHDGGGFGDCLQDNCNNHWCTYNDIELSTPQKDWKEIAEKRLSMVRSANGKYGRATQQIKDLELSLDVMRIASRITADRLNARRILLHKANANLLTAIAIASIGWGALLFTWATIL